MTTGNARLARAMMTSASIAALCAMAPQLASAQAVLTGAPYKAMTAGTVTTTTGSADNFGPYTGVYVYPAATGVVTIDGATVTTTGSNVSGIYIDSSASEPGQLDVNLVGVNAISSTSSAINIYTQGASVTLDARAGGSTLTSETAYVLGVTSANGDVTILNGGNTINGGVGGIFGGANGAGHDVTIQSNGGTITATEFGIVAQGFYSGGDVSVGGVGGMTTAISVSSPTGIGLYTTAAGAGTLNIATGAGGTINGGSTGILASASGAGAVTVNVGAAIGQSSAPTSSAITARGRGAVTINTTAAITGGTSGISASTDGGVGDINVSTASVSQSGAAFNGSAVTMEIWGSGAFAGSGDINYTLTGPSVVRGKTGILATTNGAGDITIRSQNAGAQIIGTSGAAIDARAAGGAIIIETAGQTQGAISARNSGAGSIKIVSSGPITGATGIVASSSGTGAIKIGEIGAPMGPVTATTNTGISATSFGTVEVNSGAVTALLGAAITATGYEGTTVNAGGPIQAKKIGITANSISSKAINVNTTSTVTSETSLGINANNGGTGTVNVGTAGNRLGGAVTAGGIGIFAASVGDVNVYAGQVTGGTRGILAASQGVGANGAVTIDANGPVVGASSFGIVGVNNGVLAGNTLTIRTGAVTSTGGSAISAQANRGDIAITTGGAISASSAANGTWDAIYSEGYGDNNITIDAQSSVIGTNVGIEAILNSATTRGAITVSATGPIQGGRGVNAVSTGVGGVVLGTTSARLGPITGTNGAGVFTTSAGDISIATGAVTSTGGTANVPVTANANTTAPTSFNGFGVAAVATGGGKISIDTAGPVTGGAAGGVLAIATTGPVTITTADVTAGTGRAVEANTTSGAINVTTTGAIDGATTGILAQSAGAGAITVKASGTVRSGTGYAIVANNTGDGDVTVGSTDQRIGAVTTGTTGIFAASQGDVTVHASQITAGTRGIVAASQGAAPNGAVTVSSSGPIVANASFGVVAVNFGENAGNSVAVNTAGSVTSTGGSGISAQTQNGDITVTTGAVTANSAANGTWDGIFADGRGDSLVKVTTTGPVSGSFNGVEAYSDGTTERSGILITTGGAVTSGATQSAIIANLVGQGAININTAAGGLLTSLDGHGIRANTTGAAGATNIHINNLSAIGATGGPVRYGIVAQVNDAANAGSVTIGSDGGAIVATDFGIAGKAAGSGAVTIVSGSAITATGVGIYGSTTSGDLTITTTSAGKIAPGAAIGIDAQTTTGAILINQAGDIGVAGVGGTVGMGIRAQIASGSSDLTVNSTGHVYVTAGTGLQSAGIYAVHGGTGAINVTSSGVIDPGAYGVVVQGGGAVSYAANGGVVEGDVGAYVASTGAGPVVVTSAAGTQINGFHGAGVDISSVGGGVSFNNAGKVVGSTSGILLATSGAGGVDLVTSGAVTGQSGQGVSAIGGTGLTSVVVNGSVSGATTGVFASSTGAGSTVVTTNGPVSGASTSGITVNSGTGGLTLNVNANVLSASGPAINATSAAGGVINIAANTVVAGQVNTADTAVINLATASGASSTINVAKGAVVQSASGSAFNVAIRATGGSVVVNNSGVLSGRVDFSALTGDNVGQIVSAAGTSFETGGLSVFGAGNDTFVNAGQLIALGSLTTFDFLGGTNVFTNNGTTFVGFNPVNPTGSSFVLASLTTFNNAGVLEMANGIAGDSIIATGANYIGTGAARLSIDTNLGAPGGLSDRLTIGSSSGRTAVRVRDTSTGFSYLNTAGTLVVAGTTHAGDFVLDAGSSWYNADLFGGAIDQPGLFFSKLAVDGSRGTVLVSAPKVQAYQFATLGAQAQTLWHATAGADERRAELRDYLDPAAAELAQTRPGFWVKADIAGADRQATQSFKSLGTTYDYDTGYSQGLVSMTGGYDRVTRTADGGHAFGASLGFVDSDTDFDQAASQTHMEGFVGSGYVSLVKGGMFVSASVGGSSLTADFEAPRLAGYASQETDITSVGGSLEAGLRHGFRGAVIEPSLGLAYVNATIDDIATAGSTFRYDDAESLRASLGARLSGDMKSGEAWTLRYAVSLRAVEELSGDNGVTVVNAGSPLKIEDQVFDSTFGELSAGLVGESRGGWTTFGDAKVRFNDLYTETGVSLGARLKF